MSTKIFVNLPVKDLDRSVAFFTALGFTFNPQFTDFPGTNPLDTAAYVPSAPLAGPDCETLDPAAFDPAPFIGALQNGGINWLNDAPPCAAGQVGGCWLSAELG